MAGSSGQQAEQIADLALPPRQCLQVSAVVHGRQGAIAKQKLYSLEAEHTGTGIGPPPPNTPRPERKAILLAFQMLQMFSLCLHAQEHTEYA